MSPDSGDCSRPEGDQNDNSERITNISGGARYRHVLLGSELPVGARVTLAGWGPALGARPALLGLRACARRSLRTSA